MRKYIKSLNIIALSCLGLLCFYMCAAKVAHAASQSNEEKIINEKMQELSANASDIGIQSSLIATDVVNYPNPTLIKMIEDAYPEGVKRVIDIGKEEEKENSSGIFPEASRILGMYDDKTSFTKNNEINTKSTSSAPTPEQAPQQAALPNQTAQPVETNNNSQIQNTGSSTTTPYVKEQVNSASPN